MESQHCGAGLAPLSLYWPDLQHSTDSEAANRRHAVEFISSDTDRCSMLHLTRVTACSKPSNMGSPDLNNVVMASS